MYIDIIAAAIVGVIIGALWYSPLLFGKQWMKLMGIKKTTNKHMAHRYLIQVGSVLVTAAVLAGLLKDTVSLASAAGVAFWIWLGFVAPMGLAPVLWTGKKTGAYVLDTIYHLVVLVVMALIIVAL